MCAVQIVNASSEMPKHGLQPGMGESFKRALLDEPAHLLMIFQRSSNLKLAFQFFSRRAYLLRFVIESCAWSFKKV